MPNFLMKPKIDFAFKEIMMNPNDIRETRILNTNLRKLHEDDKQGILDVRILISKFSFPNSKYGQTVPYSIFPRCM